MKTENINVLIAKAFTNFGYEVLTRDEFVIFEPINLEITGIIQANNTIEEPSNFKTFIKIILNCKTKNINPIFEFTYGWGESKKESIIVAIERWLESDFPVIHDWLADHKIHDYCTEFKIRSIIIDTKEKLYFKGIMGPLSNYNGTETKFDKENQSKLLVLLNDALTTDFLDKKGIYPVKCFVSKDRNNNIKIDCRVNGEIWERGYNTLFNYCEKDWKVDKLTFWKQYFIIYTVKSFEVNEKVEQATSEKIREISNENHTEIRPKKWWEFWRK